MLSPAIRTTEAELPRPLPWNCILCLWFSATLVVLLTPFISSASFFVQLSTLIPIFSIFFSFNYPHPPFSLMLPNTQFSSPFLLYPLSISCFVCKPQGREMGEKHSLCTTVTKDWWVISTYVPVSLLPQKKKNNKKKTHARAHIYGEKTLKLPAVHLQEDTYRCARVSAGHTRHARLWDTGVHTCIPQLYQTALKLKPKSHHRR